MSNVDFLQYFELFIGNSRHTPSVYGVPKRLINVLELKYAVLLVTRSMIRSTMIMVVS